MPWLTQCICTIFNKLKNKNITLVSLASDFLDLVAISLVGVALRLVDLDAVLFEVDILIIQI